MPPPLRPSSLFFCRRRPWSNNGRTQVTLTSLCGRKEEDSRWWSIPDDKWGRFVGINALVGGAVAGGLTLERATRNSDCLEDRAASAVIASGVLGAGFMVIASLAGALFHPAAWVGMTLLPFAPHTLAPLVRATHRLRHEKKKENN